MPDIKTDRDDYIDALIELIKNTSDEPMNAGFVDGLVQLPDSVLEKLFKEYKQKADDFDSRQQRTTNGIRPLQLG